MSKSEPLQNKYLSRSNKAFSLASEDFSQMLTTVLGEGIIIRFRAKGLSMHPFIQDGDVVTVKPIGARSPGLGQVIALIHPHTKRAVLHRVVKKKKDFYISKGDNSYENDGLIPADHVLGIVEKVERNDKNIHLGFGAEKYLLVLLGRFTFFWKSINSLKECLFSKNQKSP